MYHFAGIICAIHLNTSGKFSIGNTKSDKNIDGTIKTIPQINVADSCVFVNVDTSRPRAKDSIM